MLGDIIEAFDNAITKYEQAQKYVISETSSTQNGDLLKLAEETTKLRLEFLVNLRMVAE